MTSLLDAIIRATRDPFDRSQSHPLVVLGVVRGEAVESMRLKQSGANYSLTMFIVAFICFSCFATVKRNSNYRNMKANVWFSYIFP